MPYALTGFVFREITWDPALTIEPMRELTQKRFFGSEAPSYLASDLWKLRELIRKRSGLNELNAIDQRIQEARVSAGPKTTAGLDLMARASGDLRKFLAQTKKR